MSAPKKPIADGFSKVIDQVQLSAKEARKGRELSTMQFEKVEAQLHKLRRAAKHAKVLAIGTCLAIEDLTIEIAAAVRRKTSKPKKT